MSTGYTSSFPYLSQFLLACFNQDWNHEFESAEEAVADYVSTSKGLEVWAIIADIDRFLLYKSPDVDDAYRTSFPAGPVIGAWNLNAREWLQWIQTLIRQQAPRLPVQ